MGLEACIPGMRKQSEVSFGSQSSPNPRRKHVISDGRGGAWASTVACLALGSGINFSPLAGFCTFILMIFQVLILSLILE